MTDAATASRNIHLHNLPVHASSRPEPRSIIAAEWNQWNLVRFAGTIKAFVGKISYRL